MQRALPLAPVALEVLEIGVDLRQRLPHLIEQLRERMLPSIEVPTGLRLQLPECCLRSSNTTQIALVWLLGVSPITLPIRGAATPAHLEDNLAAAALQLDQDEIHAITAGSAPPPRLRTAEQGWKESVAGASVRVP